MLTVTVERRGRTWYGRPTFSVTIEDPTGKIGLHGYSRKDADGLAATLRTLIGDQPVGPIARLFASHFLGYTPEPGEEWTINP